MEGILKGARPRRKPPRKPKEKYCYRLRNRVARDWVLADRSGFEGLIKGDEPAAHNQAGPKNQGERRRQLRLRADAGVLFFRMAVNLLPENQRVYSDQRKSDIFTQKEGLPHSLTGSAQASSKPVPTTTTKPNRFHGPELIPHIRESAARHQPAQQTQVAGQQHSAKQGNRQQMYAADDRVRKPALADRDTQTPYSQSSRASI